MKICRSTSLQFSLHRLPILLAAGLLVFTSVVWTQQASARSSLNREDKAFVTEAAKGNTGEVLIGAEAAEKGGSNAVRQFGRRLVDDHQAANEKLIRIAKANGVRWPRHVTAEQRRLSKKLRHSSGAAFDKRFIKAQVKDHEKDIAKYRKAADKVHNQRLKQYIQETLPILEGHLNEARSLAKSEQ